MRRGLPIFRKSAEALHSAVAVSSENMLVLRLALPPMAASQRKTAAVFAVEQFIGQPLEDVEVILSAQKDDGAVGGYLAVVISRPALNEILNQNRDNRRRLLPDVLLLPRPAANQWVAAERGGRLLARLPDGTGFSVTQAAFHAIWMQSGQPAITWISGTAPAELPLSSRFAQTLSQTPEPALISFELARGRAPHWRQPRKLLAVAAVLIVGLCVHLGLLAMDARRITKIADAAELHLRQDLIDRGFDVGTSVEAAATEALRAMNVGKQPDFLPILSSVLQATADQSGTVTLQDISFDIRSGQLVLTLIASDLGPLQDTAALLTKAGLEATLGSSTVSGGLARASVAITAGVTG